MRNFFIKSIFVSLILTSATMQTQASGIYNESGGLVIIEVENTASPLDQWQEQSALPGFTGDGYLQFLGNAYTHGPADSPLEYTFQINQSGLYYLHLHAAKTNIIEGVEERRDVANDCYVRVEGDYNAGPGPYTSPGDNASLAQLTTDTKYYTYTEQATDKWKWENGTGNGEGNLDPTSGGKRIAVYDFKAGETYKLVVSGRSKFFRLNRVMFRLASVSTSAAQNLSNPESEIISAASYIYDATEDFPSITNGVVPYYVHTAEDALAIDATVVSNRGLFATASRTFDGEAGVYDVILTALRELDGECTYRFVVNSNVVGSVQNGETTVDYAPQKHVFRNITIPAGATISVESNTDTNGKVPENGGTAWARGRWREVELTPSNLSLIKPPAGRLALVSDGNSPDPDDIGAKAVAFGILKASGLNDRLVHLSHSCDLDPFTNPGSQTIDPVNELLRQSKLHELSGEGIQFFGPFPNLADYYNCRSNETAAVADLTAAIDASTAEDPLWIIEAGEPDIIGFALSNAVPSKRQYVHIISHHPANDDSGDYVTWAEILAYGITEHQIGDQNVGLKVDISSGLWDWAENNSDPNMAWIWDQLKYAEQDPVVGFQAGKFDCSDAGMMYWWLTGADMGGNSNSTPVEMKALLLNEGSAPPVSESIAQVVTGDWDAGTTWASGSIPESGYDYTAALFLNVNNAASAFGGDSLTMETGGWLRLRDSANTFVVNNLIMDGGRIYGATGNNVTFSLDGNISILSNTDFQTYWNASGPRNLNILSKISGTNTITCLASNDDSTHSITIANSANDFSGTWISENGTLIFSNAGAVGAGDLEVLEYGKLQILGDWEAYAKLTVADTATASVDLGTYMWTVTSLDFGGLSVPASTYTAAQLNALGINAVFTGSGTLQVSPPPAQTVVAGWDTWSSSTAPTASVTLPSVTASATASATGGSWSIGDNSGRGSSKDMTWGTIAGPPPASAVTDVGPANFTLQNGKTDGEITFTIVNNGSEAIVLDQFHFDAVAFRPNAPRAYALNVLAGSDITVGNVFTSADDEITHLGGGLLTDDLNPLTHDQHDDIDLDLTGLADHTLEAGETAVIQLAFSSGTGSGGGHHLFVDNVAVSQLVSAPPVESPVLDIAMSESGMVFSWTGDGFKVQSRTNLTVGIWQDVPGGETPPFAVIPSEAEAFFRLIEQ